MAKDFKNIEEQICILKSRGMIFEDEVFAKEKLLETNYYNIVNGYKRLFVSLDQNGNEYFKKNTKFEELFYLSEFDRSIRTVFLENILKIENKLKTLVAYYFSEQYGHDNYLKLDNFDTMKDYCKDEKSIEQRIKNIQYLISSIQKEIADSIKKDYIKHYVMKYGYVPLWVLINALSLGTIAKFYEYMKQPLRVKIAKHFGIKESELGIYIKLLAFWRNLCAHDERLYDSRSYRQISLPDTKYHEMLEIEKSGNQYIKGKNDLFALTIVMKILLSDNDFNHFYNKLNGRIYSIASKLESINIEEVKQLMGFPFGWVQIRKS